MAIDLEVYKEQRLVLFRLVRAVDGCAAVADAPEPDARGWLHDPAQSATPATVHGPVIGLPRSTGGQTSTARVKLERVLVEAAAPVHVRVRAGAGDDVLTVTTPAAGQPLAADGIITVQAGDIATPDRFAIVEVRMGAADGPVAFEFGVRIFQMRVVRLAPHNVSINGTATNVTNADMTRIVRAVNAIYRPIGIEFRSANFPAAAVVRTGYRQAGHVTYNGGAAAHPVPGSAPPVNVPAHDFGEFHGILGQSRVAGHVNVYFVSNFMNCDPGGVTMAGGAVSKGASPAGHGMIMTPAYANNGHVLAHELGHMLELDHPNQNAAGADVLQNIHMHLRLMFAYIRLPASPGYRSDVGYGAGLAGDQLTQRNKVHDTRDRDWYDARSHATYNY